MGMCLHVRMLNLIIEIIIVRIVVTYILDVFNLQVGGAEPLHVPVNYVGGYYL